MIIQKKSIQMLLMLVASGAVFMDYLDTSIVSIALPAITADLGVGSALSSWVMTGYLLALGSMLLVFGKIADRTGRYRAIFLSGFTLFTIASLLCALSGTILMLILCRIVQGIAAAMMVGTATMLVTLHLPEKMIGMAAGVLATVGGAALAFGPGIGGIIAEFLSWHWIFLINIPIGILGVVCGMAVIPKTPAHTDTAERKPFDIAGAVLLTATLVTLLAGLEIGSAGGWTAPAVLLLAAAPVLGVIFFRREMRHEDPVLPAQILRSRTVVLAAVSVLFITIVYLGTIYIMPFYLTGVLGLGSAISGIIMLIPPVTMMILGIPAGALTNTFGCRKLCNISCLAAIVSSAILAIAVTKTLFPLIFIGLVILGFALGTNEGPSIRRITLHCAPELQGSAGSLTYTVMNVGSVLGIAVFSAAASSLSGGVEAYTTAGIALSFIFGIVAAVISYVTSRISRDTVRN
ncbi:MAG: MFS transporter [Methanocorpusculum sp.]|nr:MFS transporter [Methanocorpusculum sp.]